MVKPQPTLIDFTAQAMEDGFDEIIQRSGLATWFLKSTPIPSMPESSLVPGSLY